MRRPIHQITVAKDGSRATVQTDFDAVCKDFLDAIDLSPKNEAALFEAHVQMIVWGVLFVEGLSNRKLYQVTRKEFRKAEFVPYYWALTKQSRLQDKLMFLAEYAGVKVTTYKPLLNRFNRMIEERNRLFHYKEVPTEFDFPTLRQKLEINAPLNDWLKHAPLPQIVTELFSTPLVDRQATISQVERLLERIT